MYLISSCLVGVNCRYNGTSSLNLALKQLIEEGKAIAVCPEILVGLPTPRASCEIQREAGCRVVRSKAGEDFTSLFSQAAIATLKICNDHGVTKAILQSRSPSCGYGKVYNGTFDGNLIQGNGITADLLFKSDIEVFTEEDWIEESC